MKKVSIAIFALVYLVVCSGIVIDFHFCMGKMAYIDLAKAPVKCSKCGMKATAGSCCKHELKIVKLTDSHTFTSNEVTFNSPEAILSYFSQPVNTEPQFALLAGSNNNHPPPEYYRDRLFILNNNFRI